MRGHIQKRGNSYRIAISIGKDPVTGKYRYRWETLTGNSKARDEQSTKLVYEAQQGIDIIPSKITLGEYMDRWMEFRKPDLGPRTAEVYEMNIRNHIKPCLGSVKLKDLKKQHIVSFYSNRIEAGLSACTVDHLRTLLHAALEQAVEWELVIRNVAHKVKSPRVIRPEMQYWTQSELNHFIKAIGESEYFALFHLDLFSGLRRSELLGLKWKDINFKNGEMSIVRALHHKKDGTNVYRPPKSEKGRRTITLTPDSKRVLQMHYRHDKAVMADLDTPFSSDTPVFCHQDTGEPLLPGSVSHAWSRLIDSVPGLKRIRLHDARHSHASILLAMGIHPKVVQERLGHYSMSFTMDVYSHVMPGLQQAAANSFDAVLDARYNDEDDDEDDN
jgi:integrase